MHRYVFSSGVASSARRSTSQTSGPGSPSRTATARTKATSASSGPVLPSWICATCQADAGSAAARAATRTGAGAPGASRRRVNWPPLLPVAGGTAVGGRAAQTRTLCGTSMQEASPASAIRSRQHRRVAAVLVARDPAERQRPARAQPGDHRPGQRRARLEGVVAAGMPQRARRGA